MCNYYKHRDGSFIKITQNNQDCPEEYVSDDTGEEKKTARKKQKMDNGYDSNDSPSQKLLKELCESLKEKNGTSSSSSSTTTTATTPPSALPTTVAGCIEQLEKLQNIGPSIMDEKRLNNLRERLNKQIEKLLEL